jgi:hypothetical protein
LQRGGASSSSSTWWSTGDKGKGKNGGAGTGSTSWWWNKGGKHVMFGKGGGERDDLFQQSPSSPTFVSDVGKSDAGMSSDGDISDDSKGADKGTGKDTGKGSGKGTGKGSGKGTGKDTGKDTGVGSDSNHSTESRPALWCIVRS